MERTSNLILIDGDTRRRAAISHALSTAMHVEPFENVTELGMAWPRSGVVVIHDEPGAIRALIEKMARHAAWFPVIAFAEAPSSRRVAQAIFDGALEYMTWSFAAEELKAALERAFTRTGNFGHARLRELTARARLERLTRREREVLGGVANGLSNRLIGERLSISPRTVEIHRANMLNKLGANHTSDAIRIAIEAAIVN